MNRVGQQQVHEHSIGKHDQSGTNFLHGHSGLILNPARSELDKGEKAGSTANSLRAVRITLPNLL